MIGETMTAVQRILPSLGYCVLGFPAGFSTTQLIGQQPASQPKNWTAAEDHQNMLDQLGIKALRPGPNGHENAPNHANYDEAKANPFPDLPDVLTLKNGNKVKTRDAWWNQR